ncbi:MAG TPA: Holliday junction resolvase RuvX [Dehalococcoidia bacterium]|nr:Holliday junction resolvase RuvX [Dehalococcoidia bacterium]
MPRLLGLDVGERRLGVAVSDPDGVLASPVAVVERRGTLLDFRAIADLAEAHEVARIIVGLPISLNGSIGPQAQRVLAFIEELRPLTPVPIETWDERYTSVAAEDLLRQAGLSPAKRRQRIDSAAAAVLLQDYLDSHHAKAPP